MRGAGPGRWKTSIAYVADAGVGAPREAPVELWNNEARTLMSDAAALAFGVALRQAAPACNVNLAHSSCAKPRGGAGPPIAGTPTTGQTADATLRHDVFMWGFG